MVLLSPKGIIAPLPLTVRNGIPFADELKNISAQGQQADPEDAVRENVNIFTAITVFQSCSPEWSFLALLPVPSMGTFWNREPTSAVKSCLLFRDGCETKNIPSETLLD